MLHPRATSPRRIRPRRRTVIAILAVAALFAVGSIGVSPTPAGAQSGDASAYLSKVNALRASAGVAPLQLDGNLSSVAQGWAQTLANRGALAHAGDLSVGVTASWTKLGENVGMGPDTNTIFNAFVNSSAHYANLVDPAFTHIGIGVVWAGNVQFTTHRFMATGGGAPAAAPAPAPAPAPARAQPPAQPAATPPTGGAGSSGGGGTGSTAPATPTPAPVTPPPATPERVGAIVDAFRAIPT